MSSWGFNSDDMRQMEQLGIGLEKIEEQMGLFSGPQPFSRLDRPCTPGDGITVLTQAEQESYLKLFESEGGNIASSKFVPASGAATRMFKALLSKQSGMLRRDDLVREASAGDKEAAEVLLFFDNIKEFAFFDDLKASLASAGLDIEKLIKSDRFALIIERLLSSKGLGYADLPKGLLPFHRYQGGARTAFEEHLVEAAYYALDGQGLCRLSMTVSPEHMGRFKALERRVVNLYEEMLGVRFDVGFSFQSSSTDTIAVTPDNKPFRTEEGKLLFRPAGHGALLGNLSQLDCDAAFITNIDNVVPDRLKGEVVRWKMILGGLLLSLRKETFGYIRKLSQGVSDRNFLDSVIKFASGVLHLPVRRLASLTGPDLAMGLISLLDRPIRVCGMVKNQGEPGGGPFWVRDEAGDAWPQIVEKAQVNLDSPDQRAAFDGSTHFNPVDIACCIKDRDGRRHDLSKFRDPRAVFISKKSYKGKELKALELPGLWNGSMAWWITVFVEVPPETFNPVKVVNDLLRPAHRGS